MKSANCATISYFSAIECNIFGHFSRFIMEVLKIFSRQTQGRHKGVCCQCYNVTTDFWPLTFFFVSFI